MCSLRFPKNRKIAALYWACYRRGKRTNLFELDVKSPAYSPKTKKNFQQKKKVEKTNAEKRNKTLTIIV